MTEADGDEPTDGDADTASVTALERGADESASIEPVSEYERMLDDVDLAIHEARRKIESGRIRSPEHERTRIKQWRALGYLLNVRRQIVETRDLEELAAEIEELKRRHDT